MESRQQGNGMNKRDKKALNRLNRNLANYRDLVLTREVIHGALLQRISRLCRIAQEMQSRNTLPANLNSYGLYAWEVECTAKELRRLVEEL